MAGWNFKDALREQGVPISEELPNPGRRRSGASFYRGGEERLNAPLVLAQVGREVRSTYNKMSK